MKLLTVIRDPYKPGEQAWIIVQWHAKTRCVALRLWSRYETRFDICLDMDVEKWWQRYLIINFRPWGVSLYVRG